MRGHAELKDVEGSGAEVDRLTGEVSEVDQEIGAFGWGEGEELLLGRCWKQALIAADLSHGLVVVEGEAEEAAVGGVEDAEAIEARFDLEVRTDFAVDEDTVRSKFRNPRMIRISGGGVKELAVGCEVTVVKDEGNLVFAGGEMERVFVGVADEEETKETGVGVESVEAHGVVVIPEGRGVLFERIDAGSALTGDEPVGGVAVGFGGDASAVDVGDGADVGDVVAAAVEAVVDGQKVRGGKVVDPLDFEGMSRARFDDGSERCWAVAPHAGGWDVAMDLGLYLTHGDAEFAGVRYAHGLGDGECVDKGGELEDVQHRDGLVWRVWGGLLGERHLVHVVHLAEAVAGAVEKAEGGGLLQEASAGRTGIGQRGGLRSSEASKKARTPLGSACLQRYKVNVTAM